MERSRAYQVPFPVWPPLTPTHSSMTQCCALPGGNPLSASAIHLPGVPSTPLPDPCRLASEDGA